MNSHPRTYHLITFGCQMNDYDSALMESILRAKGWSPVANEEAADVVLLNTCSVREGAEERAKGRLSRLKSRKDENPDLILGICGCVAQREGEAILKSMPYLDLVMGTRAIPKLSNLLDEVAATRRPQVCVDTIDQPMPFEYFPEFADPLKAFVTVMYGCDKYCSFCIVPITRGREQSRSVDEICAEVRRQVDRGVKEITLIGQNVNAYRSDGVDFADLLAAANEIRGVERIRYTTSHPKEFSDRMIEAVASLDKVCENFHLPVQAGNNYVLRRMARGYTREEYQELIAKIRAAVPGAAITTDLMVGFPLESEEAFEETMDLVERVRWDMAYMFMYSPRPNTPAARWHNDVALAEKKRRLQRLIERQEAISGEINMELRGSHQELLIEGPSRRNPRELMGRTRGDKVVIVEGGTELIGRVVHVEITDTARHTLFGRRVEVIPAATAC